MSFEALYAADIRVATRDAQRSVVRFQKGKKDTVEKYLPIKLPEGFTVTAHTGAMLARPNARQSIREAILAGADVAEIDLNFRKDGTPVLSHGKPGAKSGYPLESALADAATSDRILLNIDLKSVAFAEKLPGMLEKYGLLGRAFFTGVMPEFAKELKVRCPEIPFYLNHWSAPDFKDSDEEIDKKIKEIKAAGAIGINMNTGNFSKKLCDKMHENGLLVSVWTVDRISDMYKVLALSPDNITTRQPIVLLKIIGR